MSKNALVISGGGAKGAFAVGAVQYMIEDMKLKFDIVCGTSIGAIIAPLIVTDEVRELVTMFKSFRTKDLLRKRCLLLALLKYDSIYDVKSGWKMIQREITEDRAKRILKSGKQMFLATINLQSGQVVYFQSGPPADPDNKSKVIPIETQDQLQKAVLASANQPVLMSPVEVLPDADPVRQYVDGGVRELAPLKIAIDNGATDIYAIILRPERYEPVNVRFKKIPKILLRTISLFTEEVVLNDSEIAKLYNKGVLIRNRIKKEFGLSEERVEELFSVEDHPDPFKDKRVIALHIIRPECGLHIDSLEFKPKVISEMFKLGRCRAAQVLGRALSTDEHGK